MSTFYREIKAVIADNIEEREARAIALMLFEDVAGMSQMDVLMGREPSPEQRERMLQMAHRMAAGEPVQYVTGKADFCGLTFSVAPGVLIPRPETQELVELVAKTLLGDEYDASVMSYDRWGGEILDIGTGSGCIAVSLAKRLPHAKVSAWDISDAALTIAQHNAQQHSVDVTFQKVDVLSTDSSCIHPDGTPPHRGGGREGVSGGREGVSVIVSNPPYICRSESADMEAHVLEHEPHLALFVPDDDPLLFYRRIAELSTNLLRPHGHLFFEVNRLYANDVADMMKSLGYKDVRVHKDMYGNDRMVQGRISVLTEYALGEGVRAFSTTRHGGVSTGAYTSFNANHYCGDNPDHVAQNRQRLCQRLGIDERHLIVPHQTHDTRTLVIDDAFVQLADAERAARLEGIDAVCTTMQGVCVCVSTADCIPVLVHDPVHHAVAAIHAGWRGTVARIVSSTLDAMAEAYGTRPEDCHAVIGPGILLAAFEVGEEVYDTFNKAGFEMDGIATRMPNPVTDEQKWHINLPLCNKQQLIAAGMLPERVTLSGICTYSQCDDYFSARRLGIHSGRILNGIMLR